MDCGLWCQCSRVQVTPRNERAEEVSERSVSPKPTSQLSEHGVGVADAQDHVRDVHSVFFFCHL